MNVQVPAGLRDRHPRSLTSLTCLEPELANRQQLTCPTPSLVRLGAEGGLVASFVARCRHPNLVSLPDSKRCSSYSGFERSFFRVVGAFECLIVADAPTRAVLDHVVC